MSEKELNDLFEISQNKLNLLHVTDDFVNKFIRIGLVYIEGTDIKLTQQGLSYLQPYTYSQNENDKRLRFFEKNNI